MLSLAFAVALPGIEPKQGLYIINTKPASVAIIDLQEWKLAGTIPLDPNPSHALLHPQRRHLYVLHNGVLNPTGVVPTEPSKLSIVDLEERKPVRTMPLGWQVVKMSFLRDGRYLVCFGLGTAGSKKVTQQPGSATLIDTEKNDVVATLSAGRLGSHLLFTRDASRIFALSRGGAPAKKGAPPAARPVVTVFSPDQEKPLAEIELEREAQDMALSRDEKWLYLLDQGAPSKNPASHRNGVVHVVDAEALKLVKSHEVGTLPRGLELDAQAESVAVLAQVSAKDQTGRLYQFRGSEPTGAVDIGAEPLFVRRLGERPGRFIFCYDQMRFLGDEGTAASSFVTLNYKPGVKRPTPELDFAGGRGYPDEVLYLPGKDKAVLTVLARYRKDLWGPLVTQPTSKLAIVDLRENKVQRTVTTGRRGVKFGKALAMAALSVALSEAMTSLSYHTNYSIAQASGQPYFFYNVYRFNFMPAAPNLELAASADGKWIYALNTLSDDVTIIDSAEGEVLGHVPVGRGGRRVLLAPGGKFVVAHANKQITWIDTQTNKRHLEHQLPAGTVNALHVMEAAQRLLALTSKSLLVWDTEQGKLLTTVDGLAEPHFVVETGRP